MKFDESTRIGIIGAGAAGLSAASALEEKGYKDITILEKADRAGGKSRTVLVGGRSYELGTVILAAYYKHTFRLFEKFGLSYVSWTSQITPLNPDGSVLVFDDERSIQLKTLWETFFRLPFVALKYRDVYSPGHSTNHPDLHQPFSEFCKSNKIENLGLLVKAITTSYGYGYFDDIPAAYYLKYMRFGLLIDVLFRAKARFVREGWGTAWAKVAERYNVIYNQDITRVSRGKNVEVKSSAKDFVFDKMVVACPLDDISDVLDNNQDLQGLLSEVKHYNYYSFVCEIEGLPPVENIGTIWENLDKDKQGSLMVYYKRWADQNIFSLYVIGKPEDSEETVEEDLQRDIEKLGGKIIEKHEKRKWKYFPHVDSQAMSRGFYTDLEALQGVQNTYFAGEIMNFSTIENVVEYSNHLVEKHF